MRVGDRFRPPGQAELLRALRGAVALLDDERWGARQVACTPMKWRRELHPRWLILDRLVLRAYDNGLPSRGPGAVIVEHGCPACGSDATVYNRSDGELGFLCHECPWTV